MYIKFIILATLVLLSACSTVGKVEERHWELANCDGILGWQNCMSQVGSACHQGFDLSGQVEDLVTQKRSLKFSCR